MYDNILFDLDGTLTDPSEGITNSVAYALGKFGITVEDKKTLYKFIGPPLVVAFSEYYGFSKEDSEKATAYYRETFSVKGLYENKVYDGVVKLLETLKKSGKKLILATSKPEKFALIVLKHFGLYEYFDFVAGAFLLPPQQHTVNILSTSIDAIAIIIIFFLSICYSLLNVCILTYLPRFIYN